MDPSRESCTMRRRPCETAMRATHSSGTLPNVAFTRPPMASFVKPAITSAAPGYTSRPQVPLNSRPRIVKGSRGARGDERITRKCEEQQAHNALRPEGGTAFGEVALAP
eukprot:scaffold7679_cov403-Prasinococcus_capsulatus_cf.AAC.5